MPDQTAFEARLADAYARYVAAAPVGVDARMVAATVAAGEGRRPPRWMGVIAAGRRPWVLIAVSLMALLLAAAAILVGSRLTERPPSGGLLLYSKSWSIYLADEDGAHPRKVADAVLPIDGGRGRWYYLEDGWGRGHGPAWAPDGRHFLFFDMEGAYVASTNHIADASFTGHIADANGRVVASIPHIWTDATWAPDSTRIEAWTGGSDAGDFTRQISIYAIDGAMLETLPLPGGYVRAGGWFPGAWAPDGRSVFVRVDQRAGQMDSAWQLPLDGSAPRRLAPDDPRSEGDVTFSPDGSRIIENVEGALFVAEADGGAARRVSPKSRDWRTSAPIWSPTGTQVAYAYAPVAHTNENRFWNEIRVVDIASGTDHTVVEGDLQEDSRIGWSRGGDRILFADSDRNGSSLWSIAADGTDRRLLVPGADIGEWQP